MTGIGVLARRLDQHLLETSNGMLDIESEKKLNITESSGLTSPTLDVPEHRHRKHFRAKAQDAKARSAEKGKRRRGDQVLNVVRVAVPLKQALPQELEVLHKQMMQDVGKRLRIYFARYDDWYKGTVVGKYFLRRGSRLAINIPRGEDHQFLFPVFKYGIDAVHTE